MGNIKHKMKTILSFNQLLEGVGDKFLQKKYPGQFVSNFNEFDKKYNQMKLEQEEIIFSNPQTGWQLIKNPQTLKNLGTSVRGVITLNGDFYCESFSNSIHQDILEILFKQGILSQKPSRNWGRKLPQETGFLTVQRYKNSKWIAIGESNKIIYDEQNWLENKTSYQEILSKAQEKCPDLKFSNKLVGFKFQGLKRATSTLTEITHNFITSDLT
jgi:hypothetical protein